MPTLYIKPRCPWCIEAMDWLRNAGIEYNITNVLEDASAYQHMQKISGQSLTPTIELSGGAVLADFDVAQLEEFLTKNSLK